ncbi:hypothetical protein R1flu_003448 [Riccia fluitans]|uniref:Uncharacterized protein n=1 Tax=Riccia fluitans TaxID=41844 RepID=A0ABD1Y929_9MARC
MAGQPVRIDRAIHSFQSAVDSTMALHPAEGVDIFFLGLIRRQRQIRCFSRGIGRNLDNGSVPLLLRTGIGRTWNGAGEDIIGKWRPVSELVFM